MLPFTFGASDFCSTYKKDACLLHRINRDPTDCCIQKNIRQDRRLRFENSQCKMKTNRPGGHQTGIRESRIWYETLRFMSECLGQSLPYPPVPSSPPLLCLCFPFPFFLHSDLPCVFVAQAFLSNHHKLD